MVTTPPLRHHAPAFPGTIAVSGAAGRFGNLVTRRLHRTDDVVAIDARNFDQRPDDVSHLRSELRRKETRDVFRRNEIQAVIHLGPHHSDAHEDGGGESFTSAVEDFSKLLQYCDQYPVKKLVLLSSSNVYGARPNNPQFLLEEAPLLAPDLASLRDVDMMAQSFFWKRPDIETVILRPTNITGGVGSVMARYLRISPVPKLLGYDPMLQLVHEEDVVEAVRLALTAGHRGIFNLAGPPPLPLSKIISRLGRRSLPVPPILAKTMLSQMGRMGKSDIKASYVDFIRFVCMVDDSRARSKLGYKPRYGLEETIRAVDLWE